MRLSTQEVDHIALLSRLELSTEERERAAGELTQILSYFEKLGELDTEDVPPTSHVFPVVSILREDTARPGLTPEAALQNAPESADNMFQVPRVVEAE
jgi:aspartyl-tRNA(Asn)/glutamyl-tRNA(Gln) amidotransferase subunit C